MFKLYGNNRGMKLLDQSELEEDIVYTLGEYMGTLDTINYIIINSQPQGDTIRGIIKNYDDYINYKYTTIGKESIKTKRL